MKKIKKDNSGFTLVELLIAMAIIAIVLTPLYSNFRQSARLNGKAKLAMDDTNMASNIMEGLSAFTPEEIIVGFCSYDNLAHPERQNTLSIMPNEVTVTSYGELKQDASGNCTYQKGLVTDTLSIGGGPYDYAQANYVSAIGGSAAEPIAKYLQIKPTTTGKYYFFAEGVSQSRGTYDLLVALDASEETGYSGDANNDGEITGTEKMGYNDYEEAYITNINPMYDGVYTEGASQRANAAANLFSKRTNISLAMTAEDFYPYLMREMKIDISRDPVTNFVTVKATEEYSITQSTFTTAGGTDVNLNTDFGGVAMEYSMPTTVIFDGSKYKQEPREIYIYYMANYFSTTAGPGSSLDQFHIVNNDNVPVNIHLVRIKTTESTDANEGAYRSYVSVQELGAGSAANMNTDIYSNLRDNLTLTSEQNKANRANFNRCLVSINGHIIASSSSTYIDYYNEVIHENGGVRTEIEDRLYAVKMYVYESGAAAAGFPADMLITEFDGSSMQ